MATHSSILAWRIPWTGEPDGRQSMGSQRLSETAHGTIIIFICSSISGRSGCFRVVTTVNGAAVSLGACIFGL